MSAGLFAVDPVVLRATFIGPLEMVILLVVVLILFGGSKLPQLGESLGKSIKGFKKALSEDETAKAIDVTPKKEIAPATAAAAPTAETKPTVETKQS